MNTSLALVVGFLLLVAFWPPNLGLLFPFLSSSPRAFSCPGRKVKFQVEGKIGHQEPSRLLSPVSPIPAPDRVKSLITSFFLAIL